MVHRSLDDQGVRQVHDPNEQEREPLVDNLLYERRDESTLDEKTHEAKFHKELMALFKITETIKTERMNTTVFAVAAVATNAQPGMVSPTLALLIVIAQDLACQNEKAP